MALYLISYDIDEQNKESYQELWDLLDQMKATKILYSEYVIIGETGQASSIYNRVAPKTKQKDRLLVQEVTKDAHWDKLLISDDEFRKFLVYARG